jgi:predicted nucleic acid-binding protein
MILVDSSIWVDHLRQGDPVLSRLLNEGRVLAHPFIVGELALGNLRQRDEILGLLADLPQAVVAREGEVLHFIREHALSGSGIGYVDAHLLAATRLTGGTALWTRDKRLAQTAERLKLHAGAPH